jgi:hypothetical protein
VSQEAAAGRLTRAAAKGGNGLRLFGGGDYHEGTPLANRLGFQVARALAMNAAFARRRRPVEADLRPYVEAYERDGAFVIEDFLPSAVFAAVQAECRAVHEAGIFNSEVLDDNSVVEEQLSVKKHRSRLPVTAEHLLDGDWLPRLASALARREVSVKAVDVTWMRKAHDAPPPERLIGTNYLHADVHYPTAKAWLFLHDIDESNGAFVYAKGSQKLTPARLAYEYDASLRVAKAAAAGTLRRTTPYALLRMPTERQLRAMRVVETVMGGAPNTLLVASVMGFHRRGEFDEGRSREQIQITFRDRPS